MEQKTKHIRMIDTASIDSMIEAIRNRFADLGSDTAVIRHAVRYLFDEEVKKPDYVMLQEKRLGLTSPEARAKQQIDIKQAKENYKEEIQITKGREICELLGGMIDDKDMCTYETFMYINKNNTQRGSITLPVEQLSEKDIQGQYKMFDGSSISKEEYENLSI